MFTNPSHSFLEVGLVAAGQPGLARTLAQIAKGEAETLLIAEGVRLVDEPQIETEIEAFLASHGAEVVRVPTKGAAEQL